MNGRRSFTETAWVAVKDVRQAIDDHPFLEQLRVGTLSAATFVGYIAQDAHYLLGYARALAMCAAQATDHDDIAFWSGSARDAVVVEGSLHESFIADLPIVEPSPTCTAYVSFLLSTAGQGSYPVLASALLPCFWIYQDVGRRISDSVELGGHPYATWIANYDDPDFAAATERVRSIVDRLADQAGPDLLTRMHTAFAAAARYEWMFWDAAWRGESWPDFAAAKGSATNTATTNEATDADSHG